MKTKYRLTKNHLNSKGLSMTILILVSCCDCQLDKYIYVSNDITNMYGYIPIYSWTELELDLEFER